METKSTLYQPLLYSELFPVISGYMCVSMPSRMDIYEFTIDQGKNHSLTFIPTPFCEWIIGYNQNNMNAAFYCLGPVSKRTVIELAPYDHYIGIRFDDNVCYMNKQESAHTTSACIRDSFFEYAPSPDSFEYALIDNLKIADSFSKKMLCFTEFINKSHHLCIIPSHINELYSKLKKSNGALSIHELSTISGYSERHINRLITNQFGYGPKEYCKYIRFQRVLNEIIRNPLQSNSEFIQNIGYSDQAHFQREFKLFLGISPKQYIRYIKNFNIRT